MSERLAHTLASLHALLASEGYLAHAEGVREAQRALDQSSAAVCTQLASNAFWGGPGAISDIGFSREWVPPHAPPETLAALRARDEDAVNAANRRLDELIAALAEDFAATCTGKVHPSWIERASYLGRVHGEWAERRAR